MKTVGSLWMNSKAGQSAMASSRKNTTVAEHASDKATRAPKRSANLPTTTKTVEVANNCKKKQLM